MDNEIKFGQNSVVQMANPVFYIKENAFFDEWSLFERCKIPLDSSYFKENKNTLIIIGNLEENEFSKLEALYQSLIYPKAVLYIGQEEDFSDFLKNKFPNIIYLPFDFKSKDLSDSLQKLLGEKHA